MATKILDPWASEIIADYQQVMKDFGISSLGEDLVSRLPASHRLFRRKLLFAHRDFGRIIEAVEKKKPFAAMSGIKPTNPLHFGNKLVLEELKYLQDLGGDVFYCVADLEAYCDNGQPLDESYKIALDNVADVLALGIEPKRAFIYRQSANDTVRNLSFIYSKNVTNNMLRAIYGEKPIGLYMVALVQVGDILLPQMQEHGGPRPVVVPVGIDQDPHMRLTRDIAAKHRLVLPSSIYHKFMRSLAGEEKMSKRQPKGMITLSDAPEAAYKKVMSAITGGQATAEEQKKMGGEPLKCAVYDLVLYQLEDDDKELKRVFDECRSGKRVCGDCKAEIAEKTAGFLRGHQAKKEKLRDKAQQLLK